MASSQAQAEITERRLRPLYDAIDNRQNKKALQIADKIIKKQEDLYCAKALKAIVCQRMGRQEEGNSLIDEVVRACPGDQATLQAATMYYRETGDEQKVVDLYTQAAEQYPGNQDILTHLFMAFVRVGHYHKQQQTALQLHKAFPDNGPYYCWRVMSIVMQAHKTNDSGLANTMFLPLAERLMDKYVEERKLDVEEEVKLYVLVLEKQGKCEKKLEIIRGHLGNLIRKREEQNRLELECLLSLKRWGEAVVLLTSILQENPDHWRHIEVYISCQIQRYKDSVREAREDHERERREGGVAGREEVWEGEGEEEEEEEEVNLVNTTAGGSERQIPRTPSPKPLVDARNFLESLRNQQPPPPPRQQDSAPDSTQATPTNRPLRGPFLGRLELVKKVTQNGLQNILELPSPATLLLDYFAVFGTKSCCFDDLQSYFEFFSPDELKKFMVAAEAKITENPINFDCSEEDMKRNVSILRRQISMMQLQRYCGFHRNLSLEKKRDMVLLCKHLYREGVKLAKGVAETDAKPADFFVILAVHLLMEVYVDTREWSLIWQAILLLEHARSSKTSNPQILLLLMKLYGFLGAVEGVTDTFECLSIKHLQMETLGYIPLRYLQSSGAFGYTNQLYRSALRFYYSCAKETSEYIIQAYKNGMFQKILEFVNLRDRLSHSLSFASTLVDMNLLEVVTSIHSMEKAQQFFSRDWFNGLPSSGPALHDYCSGLVDSRDLAVYDDWSRPASTGDISSLTKLENKLSSELEVLWLRVRVMLVQCLKDSVVSLTVAPPSSPKEVGGGRGGAPEAVVVFSGKVGEMSKCLTQMAQHMGMMVLQKKRAHLLPLQTGPPCLGLRFLSLSYGHTLLVMLGVVERLALGHCDIRDKLNEVLRLLRGSVSVIHSVPEDVREVVAEIVRGTPREDKGKEDMREEQDQGGQEEGGDQRGQEEGDQRGQEEGDQGGQEEGDQGGQEGGDQRGQEEGDQGGREEGDQRGREEGDQRGQEGGDQRGQEGGDQGGQGGGDQGGQEEGRDQRGQEGGDQRGQEEGDQGGREGGDQGGQEGGDQRGEDEGDQGGREGGDQGGQEEGDQRGQGGGDQRGQEGGDQGGQEGDQRGQEEGDQGGQEGGDQGGQEGGDQRGQGGGDQRGQEEGDPGGQEGGDQGGQEEGDQGGQEEGAKEGEEERGTENEQEREKEEEEEEEAESVLLEEDACEERKQTVKNDKVSEKTKSESKAEILNSVPTKRVDFEHYSLFISVVSYIVLLTAVCVEIVKPAAGSRRKKKKKKRGSSTSSSEGSGRESSQKQHPSIPDVASYIEDLLSLLREVSRPFQPLPSVERQLINLEEKLRKCQLPCDEKNFEWSVYPQTCKLVLQSYNTSMEDCQEVLDCKLELLQTLLQRLDHTSHRRGGEGGREDK